MKKYWKANIRNSADPALHLVSGPLWIWVFILGGAL